MIMQFPELVEYNTNTTTVTVVAVLVGLLLLALGILLTIWLLRMRRWKCKQKPEDVEDMPLLCKSSQLFILTFRVLLNFPT